MQTHRQRLQGQGLVLGYRQHFKRARARACDVRLRQVHHMNVVPDCCAISCPIVIPEHLKLWPLTRSHLLHVRHQVVRHSDRVLSDEAAWMRSDRVEVAEDQELPRVIGVGHIVQ